MNVDGKRGRGMPKKRWTETIGNNMRIVEECVGDVNKWRNRTKAADPTNSREKGKEEKVENILIKYFRNNNTWLVYDYSIFYMTSNVINRRVSVGLYHSNDLKML